MRYKNIIFAIHESIKNLGNFKNYLIENTEYLVTFHFPHGYLRKSSYLEIYERGNMVLRREFPRYKGRINIIKLVLYYIYFQYVIYKYGRKNSFVIVENPIFCLFNSLPSIIKKIKFVFWIGDYYPNHTGVMWFYNKIADFYNRTLKYVIYVSPPLYEVYMKRITKKKGQFRKIVSLGIKKQFSEHRFTKRKPIFGFIGVIREQQGLDLIFNSVKQHNFTFEVIGDGYKREHYEKLAHELKIDNKVKFYGFVEDPSSILVKWRAGLALYVNSSTNVSKYCEPVKIKDYLKYGLPVITTKTTYMGEELLNFKAGEVIDETVESLKSAVEKIDENYMEYKSGVDKIVEKYKYKKWYDKEFKFLTEK